jgi:hypothetical protein
MNCWDHLIQSFRKPLSLVSVIGPVLTASASSPDGPTQRPRVIIGQAASLNLDRRPWNTCYAGLGFAPVRHPHHRGALPSAAHQAMICVCVRQHPALDAV